MALNTPSHSLKRLNVQPIDRLGPELRHASHYDEFWFFEFWPCGGGLIFIVLNGSDNEFRRNPVYRLRLRFRSRAAWYISSYGSAEAVTE